MNIKALIKSLVLRRFNSSLLLLQLALTLGLIVNSVILSLDLREKLLRPAGLDLDNTLIVEVLPTDPAFSEEAYYLSVQNEDLANIRNIDGVKMVAPHIQLPLQRGGWNGSFAKDGVDPNAEMPDELYIVPFYYSTYEGAQSFGLKLLEGRLLTPDDEFTQSSYSPDFVPNIVISESLAKKVFGDESAVGQLVSHGFPSRVVGVVSPMLNFPHKPDNQQHFSFNGGRIAMAMVPIYYTITVEPGKMSQVRANIENVFLDANPNRDIRDVFTLRDRHERFFERDTGLASLFTMLAGLMLLVTAISAFAHAQFHISRQKKLIGIRRALGARKRDVLLYVLAENWLITAVGAVLGIIAVVAFNVVLSEQVEISRPNVLLYALAVLIVFVAGTIATWLPAWQTSRIPPVIATRTV